MKLMGANLDLPTGKQDAIFFDSEVKRFGLRVRRGAGGRVLKSWIIQYRQHGRARRMLIGDAASMTAAQARERAKKLLAEVQLGHDPQADKVVQREKDKLILRSVVADFLAQKTGVKDRTMVLLRSYLEGPLYLRPLHSAPIDQITRKDIAARLLAVSKASGAPTAIAFRSAVSSLFSWAMQMGFVETNPIIGAFKPVMPRSRDRVLNNAELAAIWKGLEDDDFGKCLKLLICTGCRREEIGRMRWTEFDLDKGTWTLPGTRSKNGVPHTLPLTPMMSSILDLVARRERFDILFGRKHGFAGWSARKRALDARLGLAPWRIHDIRRSVATGMADLGIQPHVVEQVLNHQSGHRRGVSGTYNKSPYAAEVRAAMALWSGHIASITSGTERKVVAFERPAVGSTL